MSAEGAPKKRRRWIWWVVLAVAVIAVGAIVLPMLSGTSSGVSQYSTAQVTKENLTVTVSGSGNASVASAVSVDPGISGTVEDLSVKLGQTVKAGQDLFTIVNADLDAAVLRAETSYEQARQQVAQANVSLTQSKNNLYNLQHPSAVGTQTPKAATATEIKIAKQQITVAQAGGESAEENLESASLALSQARDNADKRDVTAPVGGLVTVLNAQNGKSLGSSGVSNSSSSGSSTSGSSSSAALEISDMSTLRASVSINEVDLVQVKVGQKATVTFDALPSLSVSGTVSAISPIGTNTSGVVTYDVDFTLVSIDPRLRPGMSCSAEIVTTVQNGALVVPSSAVKSTSGKQYVQVLDIGATAPRQVEVTTGQTVGTTTEIVKGLKEGEYVVTGTSTGSTSTTGSAGGGRGGFGAIFGGR
jgi:multidrug efflux pump subunit AcrA (membrane-fusion protein)